MFTIGHFLGKKRSVVDDTKKKESAVETLSHTMIDEGGTTEAGGELSRITMGVKFCQLSDDPSRLGMQQHLT